MVRRCVVVGRISAAVLAVIEALDARRLLSAGVQSGVLHIAGTAGNDVITVSRDPADTTRLLAKVNGIVQAFDDAGVSGVWIGGNAGADRVSVDEGAAPLGLPLTVHGGGGNDAISGSSRDDRLFGDGGNDSLFGHAGRDRLYGDDGNDLLHGQGGSDLIGGGAGRDIL